MSEHPSDENALSGPVSEPGDPKFPKPVLLLQPHAKLGAVNKEGVARILTCGEFGGMKRVKVLAPTEDSDGDEPEDTDVYPKVITVPCAHPSSFGIPGAEYGITPGLCFKHTKEALDDANWQKAHFLDTYAQNPELGIKAATIASGISRMNVYWWKDHDPKFRENMEAIMTLAEAILTDQVEEMVFEAIREWKPGAATIAQWWLANRRAHKWKAMGKADQAGGPTVNFKGGKHIHVGWKMGDQTMSFD